MRKKETNDKHKRLQNSGIAERDWIRESAQIPEGNYWNDEDFYLFCCELFLNWTNPHNKMNIVPKCHLNM